MISEETAVADLQAGKVSIEQVLEAMADWGCCPLLLNDDAGRWALVTSGMQRLPDPDKPVDIDGSYFVSAKEWKPTIREAVIGYLTT